MEFEEYRELFHKKTGVPCCRIGDDTVVFDKDNGYVVLQLSGDGNEYCTIVEACGNGRWCYARGYEFAKSHGCRFLGGVYIRSLKATCRSWGWKVLHYDGVAGGASVVETETGDRIICARTGSDSFKERWSLLQRIRN